MPPGRAIPLPPGLQPRGMRRDEGHGGAAGSTLPPARPTPAEGAASAELTLLRDKTRAPRGWESPKLRGCVGWVQPLSLGHIPGRGPRGDPSSSCPHACVPTHATSHWRGPSAGAVLRAGSTPAQKSGSKRGSGGGGFLGLRHRSSVRVPPSSSECPMLRCHKLSTPWGQLKSDPQNIQVLTSGTACGKRRFTDKPVGGRGQQPRRPASSVPATVAVPHTRTAVSRRETHSF